MIPQNSSIIGHSLAERGPVILSFYTICLLGILGHALYIYIVLRYRSSLNNPFYNLSLSLAVPDCLTLLAQLVYSIPLLMLATDESVMPRWYTLIVGYIADGSWFISEAHMLVIAVNRLIAVTWYESYLVIFKRRTVLLAMISCYVYGIAMVSLMYACSCYYAFPVYSWVLECEDRTGSSFDCSAFAMSMNFWLSNGIVVAIAVCYIFTLHRVRKLGQKRSYLPYRSVDTIQKRRERALVIQFAAVVFVLVAYVASFWIVPKLVYLEWIESKTGTLILNTFCLLNSSLNPFLYMTFGSEVRRKIFVPKSRFENGVKMSLKSPRHEGRLLGDWNTIG